MQGEWNSCNGKFFVLSLFFLLKTLRKLHAVAFCSPRKFSRPITFSNLICKRNRDLFVYDPRALVAIGVTKSSTCRLIRHSVQLMVVISLMTQQSRRFVRALA